MSRMITLIALALATAAVAASVAGADNGAKVDPFAVSYLAGQGLTPSEVTSWTTGDCSRENKDASCYAMLDRNAAAAVAIDPLAVSYLAGQGLTPSEVTSWTTGDCSRQNRGLPPATPCSTGTPSPPSTRSRSATWPDRASPRAKSPSWTTGDCSAEVKPASCYAMFESTTTQATGSVGFSWGDAGIGAAATLGIVFLVGALGAALVTRRHRDDHIAPA